MFYNEVFLLLLAVVITLFYACSILLFVIYKSQSVVVGFMLLIFPFSFGDERIPPHYSTGAMELHESEGFSSVVRLAHGMAHGKWDGKNATC